MEIIFKLLNTSLDYTTLKSRCYAKPRLKISEVATIRIDGCEVTIKCADTFFANIILSFWNFLLNSGMNLNIVV